MSHIDVHQRGTGKEVIGFGGNDGDFVVAKFSDKPGGGDAADSVSDDGNVHIFSFFKRTFFKKNPELRSTRNSGF